MEHAEGTTKRRKIIEYAKKMAKNETRSITNITVVSLLFDIIVHTALRRLSLYSVVMSIYRNRSRGRPKPK